MLYRAIGLMSGSSLDGLDIVFTEIEENGGKWSYRILASDCIAYTPAWAKRLETATGLSALDYQLLHADYGHFLGEAANLFIEKNELQYKVALVASHGHTTFHLPSRRMTAQLGDGAAIAAVTQLPVVTDLRAMDIAFGGQGAPIVPIGEKLLFSGYDYFLNIGGIANLSKSGSDFIAFDICPANAVLNLLAKELGQSFDEDGKIAATGVVNNALLQELNEQAYYQEPYPKSLANNFGTEKLYPLVKAHSTGSTADALSTYTEHIAQQIAKAFTAIPATGTPGKLLITGGGAFNKFLIERIRHYLDPLHIELVLPDKELILYKEALIIALAGVLRWREENNAFASVTGASRDSVGGAMWMGQED